MILTGRTRFGVSSITSILIHAFLLFGIAFTAPKSLVFKNAAPPLEIILVNAKSAAKSAHAEALAQANLAGGGNTAQERRARSPLPPQETRDQKADEVQLKRQRIAELERESRHLLTALKTAPSVESARQASETDDLVRKSLEIAKLEAQIDSDMDAYQKIPKETDVSPSTKEYRFARYIEDWRIKVERIGSLNFPEEAKKRQIFGSLLLNVCVKADGSLDRVQIVRPSGYSVLDQAALRIAKLAAPYSPLPGNIRKDTDILCIYRTWMFTKSNEMVSQ